MAEQTNSIVGLEFLPNEEVLDQFLARLQEKLSKLGAGVSEQFKQVDVAAVESSNKLKVLDDEVVKRHTDNAQKQKKTDEEVASSRAAAEQRLQTLLVAEAEKYEHIKAQYSDADKKRDRMLTEDLINDVKKLQDVKVQEQNAAAIAGRAGDKEARAIAQQRITEYNEELKLLKQVMLEKEAVLKEGAGAKTGLLGTGRQFLGGAKGEKEEGGGGGIAAMAGGMAGGLIAGGGLMGLEQLMQKGKEVLEVNEKLKIGFMTTGMTSEQAAEAIKKQAQGVDELSKKYAIDDDVIKESTAQYLKMGGSTDNLKQKQELMIAIQERLGIGAEKAAMMLAKGSSDEAIGNFKKLNLNIDKNASSAEKFEALAKAMGGTLAGMAERVDTPLGKFNALKITFDNIGKTTGALLFDILSPFISVLGKLGSLVGDYVMPLFDRFGFILKPIAGVIGGIGLVIGGATLAMSLWTLATTSNIGATIANSASKVIATGIAIGHSIALAASAVATWALNVATSALFLPITALVVGIGALVAGLIYAYNNSETFRNICEKLWETLKTGVEWFLKFGNPIGLLVTGVKALYDHFEGVRKVIDGTVETIANAGHKVLEFFGIVKDKTEEANDAAAKAAADAEKKRIAEQTKAFKSNDETLDEEYNKQARDLNVQKNKGLMSEEAHRKQMLEIDVKYWKSKVDNSEKYGQDDADSQEKLHEAEKKIEEEKKKEKAEHIKASKDALAQRKALLDEALANRKAEIETGRANEKTTDLQAKALELAAQKEHDTKLLALIGEKGKGRVQMIAALAKDEAAIRKNTEAQALAAVDDLHEIALKAILEKRIAYAQKTGEVTTEEETRREKEEKAALLAIELQYAKDKLKAVEDSGADTTKVEADVRKAELAQMDFNSAEEKRLRTERRADLAEEDKLRHDVAVQKIALIQDERLKFAAQTQLEVDDEKAKYKKDLENFKGTLEAKRLLEENHDLTIAAILKKSGDAEISSWQKSLSFLSGPAMAGINKTNQKAGQMVQELGSKVSSASALIVEANKAGADSTMGAAMANIIKGQTEFFSFAPFLAPFAIAAEVASVEALASAGASALAGAIKFGDGALIMQDTTFPNYFGPGRGAQMAERGVPEAIVPLDRMEEVSRSFRGNGDQAILHELQAQHRTLRDKQFDPPILDPQPTMDALNRGRVVRRRNQY